MFSWSDSVMWHVPGDLHEVSLRGMKRLMHWLLLLPPRPIAHLKLLYSISLLAYLAFVLHWRFGLKYTVVYNRNDYFSLVIDLINFAALVFAHLLVAMELIWRSRRDQIEQQLERMRYLLRVQFGHKLSLTRVSRYCSTIYCLLGMSWLVLLLMTAYVTLLHPSVRLLLCACYSEIVLLLHLAEFSLYISLVLAFYEELSEVSCRLMLELDKTRAEVWAIRHLSLGRLFAFQQLHGLLWDTVRTIERNFELSLIVVCLKYFVDIAVLPYWIFVNYYNDSGLSNSLYCSIEEFCKLLFIFLPSFICSRCQLQQRLLRSTFHDVARDRQNPQLNTALYRISVQLSQERFVFSAGGLLVISNETFGKYIFGLISYIIICIQFRVVLIDNSSEPAVESVVTESELQ